MRSYWHEHTVCPVMGSVNSGLPVSQQRAPFEVAEDGDVLRAPCETVVDEVTAIGAIEEESAEESCFCNCIYILLLFKI